MTIEETIRVKLLEDTVVKDMVGDRFYSAPAAHELTTPFVTYSLISATEDSDLEGKPGVNPARIQLSFISDDWQQARALLAECRRVLLDPAMRGDWAGVVIDSIFVEDMRDMGIDEATGFCRHDLDIIVWQRL